MTGKLKIIGGMILGVWLFGAVISALVVEINRRHDCVGNEGLIKGLLWCKTDSFERDGGYTRQVINGLRWPLWLLERNNDNTMRAAQVESDQSQQYSHTVTRTETLSGKAGQVDVEQDAVAAAISETFINEHNRTMAEQAEAESAKTQAATEMEQINWLKVKRSVAELIGPNPATLRHEAELKNLAGSYIAALRNEDCERVANLTFTGDLIKIKTFLVPVFFEYSTSNVIELKEIAAIFFSGSNPADIRNITGKEAYCGLLFLTRKIMPDAYIGLREGVVKVGKVVSNENEAIVEYTISIDESTFISDEKFILENGLWKIRVKEDPENTAKKFRRLLSKTGGLPQNPY